VTDAQQLGASLRRDRERQGVTLADIATETKVSASVFAALERGDLSRWPTGLYRRAFIRAYAGAIGRDPEKTLEEFLRASPEDAAESAARLRADAGPSLDVGVRRAFGAVVDVAVIGAATMAGWTFGGIGGAGLAGLLTALVWHGGGGLAWGTSPGVRLFRRADHRVAAAPVSLRAQPAAVDETPVDSPQDRLETVRASRAMLSVVGAPRRSPPRKERRAAAGHGRESSSSQ
jgi:transcriptional regulator with XRE-family HTH domain